MFRHVGRTWRKAMTFCTLTNKVYGISSKIGGASSDSLYNVYAHKFHNQDLQSFKRDVYNGKISLPGVTIITTPEECKRCVDILMQAPEAVAAWDTETMDLDIKQEAPVGKGKIICATFFAGAQYNFGRGPRVFIDNFGQNAGLIDYFKDYLESKKHLKVWHNYGFDRHLFYNHGIDVRGFGGDTMHMARLYDSSKGFGKYSLAELTSQYADGFDKLFVRLKMTHKYMKQEINVLASQPEKAKQLQKLKQKYDNIQAYLKYGGNEGSRRKQKMQMLFGRKRKLKSGKEGITYEYPTTLTLHTNRQYLQDWITYSVKDSQSTYFLRQYLEKKLKNQKTNNQQQDQPKDMWSFYQKYWLPFGQVLTDLEREGIKVDLQHLKNIEEKAKQDLKIKQEAFMNFLFSFQEGKNIDHFNPSSTLQLQQLFFAPCQTKPQDRQTSKLKERKAQIANMTESDKRLLAQAHDSDIQQKERNKQMNVEYEGEQGLLQKPKGARKPVVLSELVKTFKVENIHGTKPKFVQMEVMGLGLPSVSETPTGLPAVDLAVLETLAGNPEKGKFGKAYDYYNEKGDPQFGKKLCEALKVLVDFSHNETLLKTFIEPLSSYVDQSGRVHCSLNINTETGRLSARKPNLQNQPALDKDVYKIRKAFVAQKGKKFIVADYGQLQLRVLAHLTNCKAMLDAFKQGGDFHSRTAIGMYDYIKKQIDEGTVLLQWDKSKGQAPAPLLKDKYAAERKKAKTVNFSIAYGKTARGFSSDWGCSLDEAKTIIDAWFKERQEVKQWQQMKQQIARQKKVTQTLMGRHRNLQKFYDGLDPNKRKEGMANRRAINTPIQGGAADIVNAGMVKIAHNERLKELGWKLLMQIHDELIVEGPEESAEEAFKIVKHEMENPFSFKLRVDLQVDAKIGDNWYQCK